MSQYQSKKDLRTQQRIAEIVGHFWCMRAVHHEKYARIDGCFVRDDEMQCLFEIRRRNNNMWDHQTMVIDRGKLKALKKASKEHMVPAYFIVGWDDFLGFIDVNNIDESKEHVMNRRDGEQRSSDCVPVPTCQFTVICLNSIKKKIRD